MTLPKDPVRREEYLKAMGERKHGNKNCVGRILSDETKKRIADAHIGLKASDDTRERMSQAHKGNRSNSGRHLSEETRIKMSISHIGQKRSQETCIRIGNVHRGEVKSAEHRIKISITRIERGVAVGEKNPAWKGGISFESYPITFNNAFKQFIREYYGNICINCQKTPEENGKKLTVHHYDYDKNSQKCVPVCVRCNSVANGNREYWEGHYTNLVIQFEMNNIDR